MRTEERTDSRMFGELLRSLLRNGMAVRFQARGRSMYPAIADGDVVQVEAGAVQRGDVALVETADGLRAHRLVGASNLIVTHGDCCCGVDPYVAELLGHVSMGDRRIPSQRIGSVVRRWLARWRGRF
jgi:hypothetical protein